MHLLATASGVCFPDPPPHRPGLQAELASGRRGLREVGQICVPQREPPPRPSRASNPASTLRAWAPRDRPADALEPLKRAGYCGGGGWRWRVLDRRRRPPPHHHHRWARETGEFGLDCGGLCLGTGSVPSWAQEPASGPRRRCKRGRAAWPLGERRRKPEDAAA